MQLVLLLLAFTLAAQDVEPLPEPTVFADPTDELSAEDKATPAVVTASWRAAYARSPNAATRAVNKELRGRHCRANGRGLTIGTPARYVDTKGTKKLTDDTLWYIVSHPTFRRAPTVEIVDGVEIVTQDPGIFAVDNLDLLTGLGCVPPTANGRQDERFVDGFLWPFTLTNHVRREIGADWEAVGDGD